MKADTSKARSIVNGFFNKKNESINIQGNWNFEITRANGDIESFDVKNTLTSAGLNELARLGVSNGVGSAFLYLAIGTQTTAGSLGSVLGGLGEVSRKLAATAASSAEYMVLVMTWAGAADSLTSVDLRTASAINHASSGSGIPLNFVNSVATILAASDFLKVQMDVRVGSHAL